MTPLTEPVDGTPTGGLWLSVSELAAAKGISKQAISKRIERFLADGVVISTKRGPGGSKLVNAAEFDRAAGDIGDTLRAVIGRAPPPSDPDPEPSASAVLTTERARIAGYDAEIKRLDLEARQGKLLSIAAVQDALAECTEGFVRRVDQLHTKADDMAAAVAKDGVAGAKAMLKTIAYDLRDLIAQDMRILATTPVREDSDDVADPAARLT